MAADADDVRATIESHYAAINANDNDDALEDHLDDFTMFGADSGVLWEADFNEVSERMNATPLFGDLDVRMSNFNSQIYGDVAVVTFYLVGTQTIGGNTTNLTNRVTAVWVRDGSEWKEAHHHESILDPM